MAKRIRDKEEKRIYDREYYLEHRQQILDRQKQWRKDNPEKVKKSKERAWKPSYKLAGLEQRHLLKVKAMMHYSNPQGSFICNNCGEQDIDVLTIDHIDGKGKEHRKKDKNAKNNFYQWLQQNEYPKGYQVLCWNCNIKKSLFERRS